jgi:GNAT superfamily N-acetyltransferase
MHIVYLTAQPQHIPTLAAWHQAQWGHLNPGSTTQERAARLSLHTGQPGIPMTLLAVEADTLLGSASLVDNDLTTHPQLTPFLASVYVAPAYRGQGIASALVSRMIEEVRQIGAAQFYLITPDQQRLYARLGWSSLEHVYYRGEWVTLMSVACATPNDGL